MRKFTDIIYRHEAMQNGYEDHWNERDAYHNGTGKDRPSDEHEDRGTLIEMVNELKETCEEHARTEIELCDQINKMEAEQAELQTEFDEYVNWVLLQQLSVKENEEN